MDQWNFARASQQQGHPQGGQLGYPSGSYGGQQGASASVATPYSSQTYSQQSFGQAYGQQILGAGGKTAASDEYQGAATGAAGLGGGTSVNTSGIYSLDSKYTNSGYGVASASPAAFTQKTDQLSASQKGSDFLLAQYSKSQASYLAADGQSNALKRYSESQLEQQSQALRQQQLLQSALWQGTVPSALDSGVRSQSDYLSAGRNLAIQTAGAGTYGGGRELLGSTYGVTRSEAEAALLGTQVGLARSGVGVLPFPSQAADPLGSLAGGRGILGSMYPPATGYSGLDLASARSGISGLSDLAGIGSARYDDRLDDRIALRYEYERRDDGRRERERSRERERDRDRDHERERERERSWERERERERERDRLRERERVRERERARERERDRERELRRRERTPPRILPPPRRDEKVVRKASPPPPRFSSPLKPRKREYVCKVEPFSLAEGERDLLSLIRRYPKLFVAADFSKAVTCWRGKGFEISLNQPISFEHDAVDAEEESGTKEASTKSPEEAETSKENITWTVKVMFMSGMSSGCLKDLLSDSSTEDKPLHMHNFLRFVVLRKERSALMAVGGAWDKTLDGGDPAADEHALIRTAIRCTKDATQLDLNGVPSWIRFMEVHYDRVGDNSSRYKEVTVFLIPDLSGCLPSLENWKLQWKQRKEAKLRREASQKQEKDGKSGESPTGNANGINSGIDAGKKDKEEKKEEKDVKEEKKDVKKEEKMEKDVKREEKKEKDVKEEKKDVKKEEKKDKDVKKEEKKEKDVKKEEKKEKDVKKEEKKEKDVKKEEKKQDTKKDKKGKADRKEKEKKDERKEEKKEENDVKGTKGKGTDKKGKAKSEEEAPALPGLFITTKRNKSGKVRTMTISLDGLLDYDERDKEESTFELSLFAELFQEMLQYRHGCHILEAFETLHQAVQAKKKEERKRGRHTEKDGKAATKKKSKFSDKAEGEENKKDSTEKDAKKEDEQEKKDEPKPVKDIDAAMQEASLINFDELEEELQETPEELDVDAADEKELVQEGSETKKPERKMVVDEELLKAFRYFDRNRLGFLKAEDVRRLMHILGKFLTRRWVKELTSSALIESKSKDDCIYYQKLVEKEAE